MLLSSILDTPCLLSPGQKLALALLAKDAGPNATIVEVGPWRGGSTRILLESSQGFVHTIDMFDNVDRELVGHAERLTITVGGVDRFKEIYDGPKIDLFFIDGDHSYYGVMHDFRTLRHLLKKDTIIAFHDYNLAFIGVRIYCDALVRAGVITDTVNVDGMLVCTYTGNDRDITEADLMASLAANMEQELNCDSVKPLSDHADLDLDFMAEVLTGIGTTWQGIGRGSQGRYFAELMSLDADAFLDSKDAPVGGKYAIFSYYYTDISTFLCSERGVSENDIVDGKHLIAAAMYDDLVNNEGKRLLAASCDNGEKAFIKALAQQSEQFIHHLFIHGVFPQLFMRTSI